MKRTYASGAEKRTISDNKRKAIFNSQKVTSFFGPASVELTTGDSSGAPGECIVVELELVYDKFGLVSRQNFTSLILLNNSS